MSLSSGVKDLTSIPLICFQRRDYSALAKFLPPKHEYVVTILLSKVQKELYRKYLDNYGKSYCLHVHVVVFFLNILSSQFDQNDLPWRTYVAHGLYFSDTSLIRFMKMTMTLKTCYHIYKQMWKIPYPLIQDNMLGDVSMFSGCVPFVVISVLSVRACGGGVAPVVRVPQVGSESRHQKLSSRS